MPTKDSSRFDATENAIRLYVSRLRMVLAKDLKRTVAALRQGDISAQDTAQVIGSILSTMKANGLDKEVDALDKVYASELKYIREDFEKLGVTEVFADADREVIQTMINFDADRVMKTIEGQVADSKAFLMRAIISGNIDEIADKLDERLEGFGSRLETEINTAVSGFSRTVTFNKAAEHGFDNFEYLGPEDNITRPFCEAILTGKPGEWANGVDERSEPVYSIAEISRMDNGQGLDVMTYGGGYNCRHQFRPVSSD